MTVMKRSPRGGSQTALSREYSSAGRGSGFGSSLIGRRLPRASFALLEVCRERPQLFAVEVLEGRHEIPGLQVLARGDPAAERSGICRQQARGDGAPAADVGEVRAERAPRGRS